MKTAVVPAQVTTVEDKIAGSISLQQLVLLALPLFVGCVLYVVMPPSLSLTLPKVLLGALVVIVSCSLAIRVKGKIVLLWMVTVMHYNLRPRRYVFSKNDSYLRPSEAADGGGMAVVPPSLMAREDGAFVNPVTISMPDRIRIESAFADPRSNVAFRITKKGGLRVHITQVK